MAAGRRFGAHVTPPDTARCLGVPMRVLLVACGPMNAAGAVSFAPWFPSARRLVGLPEPPAMYLWIISAWVLAFGCAYVWQGMTGRASRGVLVLGAWGKLVFGGVLLTEWSRGAVPAFAAAAAVPDLVLAVVFGAWLWRTGRF